jgi:hypothetical protein
MSEADLLGLGSPSDPFTVALALLAAIGEPKAAQANLTRLRGVLAQIEKARADLQTERSAVETELAAKKAAFDAECAAKRAELERSSDLHAELHANLEAEKRRFAEKLAGADAVLARYAAYWRHRFQVEMPGAEALRAIPSYWRNEDVVRPDPIHQDIAGGSLRSGQSETVPTDVHDLPLPAGVSLTRVRPRRSAEL